MTGWVTNDPEAAKRLRKADREHAKTRAKSKNLPLAQKIIALRESKEKLHAAYTAAAKGEWP